MMQNTKYYTVKRQEEIVILELNYMLFLESESYEFKQDLLDLLDEMDQDKKLRVLILSNNHKDFDLENYKVRWNSFMESKDFENHILRVFRTFNEIFIKITSMKMIVISINSKALNSTLFNFSLAADLRFTSSAFYIDNDNHNMVNITKGEVAYGEMGLSTMNPFKLQFLLKKVLPPTLYKRQIIDRIYEDNLLEETLAIAKDLCLYEYYDFEVIKGLKHSRIPSIEKALQFENEFLLACIRRKVNKGTI